MAGALGYPVIVKAAMGGGGRGMRVVESDDALDPALDQVRREAQNAFGCPDVFLEKFIRRAKHIEVQLLGDRHGHLVHLHERDCSIQRRHQKVIEIAPASHLDAFVRDAICQAALVIGRKVGYENAGTVEFLVDDESGTFSFIEVNPRLQVEHTITEIVTGIDIVKSQILIAIKDMAGLCKPFAAQKLVETLRQEVGLPIHFHTHDIGGAQAASILKGAEVGLDIADGAMASMSGLTSQPSVSAIVESLRFTPRDSGIDHRALIEISRYWEDVRNMYAPFESGPRSPAADLYDLEMPGGQYTNLFQQAKALGLAARWHEVCNAYSEVNLLFGDIVKVTPSSKVVGDMALFLVANDLTPEDTLDPEREIAFPESEVEFFQGRLGQPPGGFPRELQDRVLRGRPALTDRPGQPATGRPGRSP